MKSGIICYICKKPKKFSDSYAVKFMLYEGEFKTVDGQIAIITKPVSHRVRVCRTDVKKMGYKVKAK